MKNFLVGLSIGLPLGMLLGDALRPQERSQMAEQMRHIWTEARERASEFATEAGERARRFAQDELRQMPGNAGRNLSDLLEGREAILNRVSRDELLAVYGIGPVLADRIAQGRPYASDYDVVERGILNEATFNQLRRQLLDRYRKTA